MSKIPDRHFNNHSKFTMVAILYHASNNLCVLEGSVVYQTVKGKINVAYRKPDQHSRNQPFSNNCLRHNYTVLSTRSSFIGCTLCYCNNNIMMVHVSLTSLAVLVGLSLGEIWDCSQTLYYAHTMES